MAPRQALPRLMMPSRWRLKFTPHVSGARSSQSPAWSTGSPCSPAARRPSGYSAHRRRTWAPFDLRRHVARAVSVDTTTQERRPCWVPKYGSARPDTGECEVPRTNQNRAGASDGRGVVHRRCDLGLGGIQGHPAGTCAGRGNGRHFLGTAESRGKVALRECRRALVTVEDGRQSQATAFRQYFPRRLGPTAFSRISAPDRAYP